MSLDHSTHGTATGGGRTRTVAADRTAIVEVARWWTRTRRGGKRALREIVRWSGRSVTPVGWVALVGLVLGLAGGAYFGWAEAAAGGILSAALLILAAAFVVGRQRYSVDLGLVRERVVAGDPATGSVTVVNVGRRATLPGRVDVPMGDAVAVIDVPFLRPGRSHIEAVPLPTESRGVVPVGPVRSVRIDPLGLFRLETQWPDNYRLFVHPRTVRVPGTGAGFIRDLEGDPTRVITDDDISFHALREYVPGDALRHIHGKSTAKTGVPMVRQFEETRRSRLAVVLALDAKEYGSSEEFELAVSVTGSLAVQALRDGRDVDVVVSAEIPELVRGTVRGVERLPTLTPRTVLDALSSVAASNRMLTLTQLCELLAPGAGDVSLAVLVCGSTVGLRQLRSAALRLPMGTVVLAVVVDPGAEPKIKVTGDVIVLSIGLLDDLRQLLARRVQS